MNEDLLEAFGEITMCVFDENHQTYPELLEATDTEEIGDEALIAWRLLLVIEELTIHITEAQKRCVRARVVEPRVPGLLDEIF